MSESLPLAERPSRTLVFGAGSAIAQAWIQLRAAEGDVLFLVARDLPRLEAFAQHLRIQHGVGVKCWALDYTDPKAQRQVIDDVFERAAAPVDRVLVAFGYLGETESERLRDPSLSMIQDVLSINLTAAVTLVTQLLPKLKAQGQGILIGLSSVAGDRGRASRLWYGAAKAGLSAYLSGLRNELSGTSLRVITVKPGMVDTPMTSGLKKGPLFATPERVAQDMVRAERKGACVVYTPSWWRWIMWVICHLPERVFMRLRF